MFLTDRFHWLPKGWPVLTAVAAVGVAMLAMFLWFGLALVYRRRFQFSLRSLLVLTVAVAVPCSWLAASIKEARTQYDAVSVIRAAKGEVWYDDRKDQVFPGSSPAPLPNWATFDFFCTTSDVYLGRHGSPGDHFHVVCVGDSLIVTPELLTQVAKLRHLHYLSLEGTNVGDLCLEPLWKLRELANLDLRCTQVTEAGVAKLREKIPKVRISWGWNDVSYRHRTGGAVYYARSRDDRTIPNEREIPILDLNFGHVTDAEMATLTRDCPDLEKLMLQGRSITDASLEHLKGMHQLRVLDLVETEATDSGVAKLQQALPNCKITR